tara:strand:+ start:870 stop:1160 length:291 start_codon:yes stop_codon:yes gene_type:complete
MIRNKLKTVVPILSILLMDIQQIIARDALEGAADGTSDYVRRLATKIAIAIISVGVMVGWVKGWRVAIGIILSVVGGMIIVYGAPGFMNTISGWLS